MKKGNVNIWNKDSILQMSWKDCTPCKAIAVEFEVSTSEVIKVNASKAQRKAI